MKLQYILDNVEKQKKCKRKAKEMRLINLGKQVFLYTIALPPSRKHFVGKRYPDNIAFEPTCFSFLFTTKNQQRKQNGYMISSASVGFFLILTVHMIVQWKNQEINLQTMGGIFAIIL